MPSKLYDWDRWLSKDQIKLKRGKHYSCSQSTMAQQIRSAASLREIRITLEDHGNAITVRVLGRIHAAS